MLDFKAPDEGYGFNIWMILIPKRYTVHVDQVGHRLEGVFRNSRGRTELTVYLFGYATLIEFHI